MSNTRKALIVSTLLLGTICIILSLLCKLQHWSNTIYYSLGLAALVFVGSGIVLLMRKANAE